MARTAFSFSNSMGSVPSGSKSVIAAKAQRRRQALGRFRGRLRHLQSLTETLQSETGLPGWRNWQTRQT